MSFTLYHFLLNKQKQKRGLRMKKKNTLMATPPFSQSSSDWLLLANKQVHERRLRSLTSYRAKGKRNKVSKAV